MPSNLCHTSNLALDETSSECEDGTTYFANDAPGRSIMESSSSQPPDDLRARVAGICATLGACAAGYWRLDQDAERLVQLAFVPGVGLDPEVSRQFATATATVPLSQTSLGIVAAALTGQPTVSRVAELPANSGSGRWLRAFGADRSVAVPLSDVRGSVHGVFSVALPKYCQLDDHEVVESIREVEVR